MDFTINNPKARIYSALIFAAWFWLVYWSCDYFSYFLDKKYDVTLPLDEYLPFIPFFSFFYMLINPLLILPIIASRDTYECMTVYIVLAISVFIAGIIFVVFPVIPIETPIDHNSAILQLADFVNLKHNMLPSLHVTLAMIIGLTCAPQLNKLWQLMVWVLVLLIILSTLLTRQHLIADVISGILLSIMCVWIFPAPVRKWLELRLTL